RLATLRAMSVAVTARLAAGESPLVEAALVKDLGTGLEQSIG
ncbi:MAG TPA: acyl-CoA dehydrogenase, partial [Cupriavidus sp.]|nr:acyl-CoA dehydrogenase [Cupriavidus sp.]